MKSVSLTTFIIFVFCLSTHFLGKRTQQKIEERTVSHTIEKNKVEVRKSQIVEKLIPIKQTIENVKTTSHRQPSSPKILKRLHLELQTGTMTMEELKELQKEIFSQLKSLKRKQYNTTKWDLKIVYFFLMREHLTLAEINSLNNFKGFPHISINQLKRSISSFGFEDEINSFRGISSNWDKDLLAINADDEILPPSKNVKRKKVTEQFEDDNDYQTPLQKKLRELNYSEDEIQEMHAGFETSNDYGEWD